MFRALLRSSSGGQNFISTATGIVSHPKRVTIPDAVLIQFCPPEDERNSARNM